MQTETLMSFSPRDYLVGKDPCYGLNNVPLKRYVEVLNPILRTVTLFGNQVFADLSKLKSLGCALTQYSCCPCIKGEISQRQT